MAKSKTSNPVDKVNGYMSGAASLHYAKKDDNDAAVRLMAHAYSRKDADGDMDIDTLGAIALADVERLGFENSGIGNRAGEDYKKFRDGLEACTVSQIRNSKLVKGLDDTVLEKMVAKDASKTWKDATKKFEFYRLERDEATLVLKKALSSAKDDDDKRKAREGYEEAIRTIEESYSDTLRVVESVSVAQESAFAILNSNATLAASYSKKRLSPEAIKRMARGED